MYEPCNCGLNVVQIMTLGIIETGSDENQPQNILLETGDDLLLEDDQQILLENTP